MIGTCNRCGNEVDANGQCKLIGCIEKQPVSTGEYSILDAYIARCLLAERLISELDEKNHRLKQRHTEYLAMIRDVFSVVSNVVDTNNVRMAGSEDGMDTLRYWKERVSEMKAEGAFDDVPIL